MNLDIASMVFNLIGGLGIFLYGMRMMSEGLQKVAGDRLRSIFGMVTSNRFAGVFTGFLVTAIIQSSSATTVMLVGFVNAGLMSLQQAIHVILGANLGTTFTGWIIAFKITKYGLPLIGVGAGLVLFSKSSRVNYIGQVLLGLGMLFFGLTLMKMGFAPLRGEPTFHNFFLLFGAQTYFKIIMSALAGCMLTVVLQSSSATVGITMGLASQGLLSFPAAAALVLGENIGTTITALLSSIGTDTNARRTALSHCLFNTLGVIVMIIIFPIYLQFVEHVIPGLADKVLADGTKPNITAHIAASHTIFNIANMIIFLPFVTLLSRLVCFLIKDKEVEEKDARLVYLHFDAHGVPNLMIDSARREIERMMDMAILMLITSMDYVFKSGEQPGDVRKQTKASEKDVDKMQEEIVQYLSMVSRHRALTEKDVEDIHIYIRVVDETESVADYAQRLVNMAHQKIKNDIGFSEEAIKDLGNIFQEVIDFLTRAKYCFLHRDETLLEECDNRRKAINKMIKKAHKAHITRLREGVCEVLPSIYVNNFLNNLGRVRGHATNIVEASMGEK